MDRLIVESYNNSTINTILEDIGKKYTIDTSKEQLSEDIEVPRSQVQVQNIFRMYKNIV